MLELLQFSLLDMTPYDKQSWFNLLGDYNLAIWWAYPFALLCTLALLSLLLRPTRLVSHHASVRWVLALFGTSWLWTGAVFHMKYFAELNWAAPWFAWIFILQGILLLLTAIFLKSATWVSFSSLRGRLGVFLLLMGLLVYPLSGLFEGRSFAQIEWFPLLPTPVTLVGFALVILLRSRWRHGLVVIPTLWAVVSGAFATTLGLLEFYFIVGAFIVWLAHYRIRD